MKRDINLILVVILLLVGIICTDYATHTYTLEYCRVIEVVEDTAVAQDLYGRTWAYKEQGDSIGDIVHLHMYDKRTNTDHDDIIRRVEVVVAEGH